jgi:hypothetical protein
MVSLTSTASSEQSPAPSAIDDTLKNEINRPPNPTNQIRKKSNRSLSNSERNRLGPEKSFFLSKHIAKNVAEPFTESERNRLKLPEPFFLFMHNRLGTEKWLSDSERDRLISEMRQTLFECNRLEEEIRFSSFWQYKKNVSEGLVPPFLFTNSANPRPPAKSRVGYGKTASRILAKSLSGKCL